VLTFVALLVGMAPATAGVATSAVAADASPALIPADATGSLTIHKHLGLPVDQTAYPANGTALVLPTSAAPLPGVVFTVTRVSDVDLTTNAGWYAALAYQDNLDGARAHAGAVRTSAPTATDGSTVVAGLPVGLYLVHEASVTLPDGSEDLTIVKGPDFLVTIPMTDPVTNSRWVFDIHVYPKNVRTPAPTPTPTPTPTSTPTPTPPGPLPWTGSDTGSALLVAGLLLGTGAIMAGLGYRRPRERPDSP
jgi:hypothetical protein